MSIASQLQAYENGLTDSYNMVSQKGGTMPVHKNMSSLASSIATIPSGGGSFIGIPKEVDSQGKYGFPSQSFSFSLPPNATDIASVGLSHAFDNCFHVTSADFSSLTAASGTSCLSYAFYGSTSLVSADFSSLVTVSGTSAFANAFLGCTNLTTLDLSSLTTVSSNSAFSSAFNGCSSLTSVDLSSLVTMSGGSAFNNAFYNCTNLTSVDLSALTTASGSSALSNSFRGCTSMTSFRFNVLSNIIGGGTFSYAFRGCTSLETVYFPALATNSFGVKTNHFDNMLYGCTGVTVHFPSAIQSTIGSWASVTSGFGGTNTTVLFDL